MPSFTLQEAITIPAAMVENFAGKSAAPHDVAFAIGNSPTSSTWKMLSGASVAYGLTEGGYNANQISLTELGRAVVAGDRGSIKAAALAPRIPKELFTRYDRQKFLKPEMASKILPSFGLPKDRTEKYYEILKANGLFAGLLRETGNGFFVALEGLHAPANDVEVETSAPPDNVVEFETRTAESESLPLMPAQPTVQPKPKQLFVAHGKNLKALEDLKKILNEFKIPYIVAIDEAHSGRPISAKVAGLMNQCSAGIFIFTKDEQFFSKNADGEYTEVWRPSENVVYELGAASKLWDRKIIIIREEGVNFPTDFKDIGYIEFEPGQLSSKAMEIFKELIALELIKLSAA
jgi:predicted nucleotide-binding protein